MSFASSYIMREHYRTGRRWLEAHWRTTALAAAGVLVAIFWLARVARPFDSRDMVILYRPSPDGSSIVFNLGDEYKLRTVRLIALDETGKETTLWRFEVPGDAPKLSTFALPPQGRQTADDPPPPIEPGKPYRLRVSASGASGVTDFSIKPNPRRQAG
ncbi:MAG: hypothetical protein IT431_10550 [Phycisphaerales bacterium]|nr:hypothetical protein [Phycisphaerales bacterium]